VTVTCRGLGFCSAQGRPGPQASALLALLPEARARRRRRGRRPSSTGSAQAPAASGVSRPDTKRKSNLRSRRRLLLRQKIWGVGTLPPGHEGWRAAYASAARSRRSNDKCLNNNTLNFKAQAPLIVSVDKYVENLWKPCAELTNLLTDIFKGKAFFL